MTRDQAEQCAAEQRRELEARGAVNIHLAPAYIEGYGWKVEGRWRLARYNDPRPAVPTENQIAEEPMQRRFLTLPIQPVTPPFEPKLLAQTVSNERAEGYELEQIHVFQVPGPEPAATFPWALLVTCKPDEPKPGPYAQPERTTV